MEKQDISNPNIDWASLVRHVAKDQITVELADGTVVSVHAIPMVFRRWGLAAFPGRGG